MEKYQRKTITELYRLGMTPAQIHHSLKYPKTAISIVVKKEDKRGERMRKKRYSRRDDRKHSSWRCCCNEKDGKLTSAKDSNKESGTGTSDTTTTKTKAKTKAKTNTETWDVLAAIKRLLFEVPRRKLTSLSSESVNSILGIVIFWGFLIVMWVMNPTEEQSSSNANSREISWKGFVNDYLAHGIVESLTVVNHERVEFKMTNDSNEKVNRLW